MTTGFPTTFEVHGGARSRLSYQTTGVAIDPATNPLAQFLTERSAMFTAAENRKGVYRSDLRHEPWQLQAAAADLDVAAFFRAGGLNEPHTTPTSYWAEAVTTTVTWPTKLQPI